MKHYSAMNKAQWKATTWINLRDIILHKRSKTQPNTSCIVSIIYNTKIVISEYII